MIETSSLQKYQDWNTMEVIVLADSSATAFLNGEVVIQALDIKYANPDTGPLPASMPWTNGSWV